jgi:flagellar biosynthetic protein FliQ
MTTDLAVDLARHTLLAALWVAVPLLLAATATGLLISIGQVLTSIQDHTITTVPRLVVMAIATILLMPWMLRRLMEFTIKLFSDFHPYIR